MPIFYICSFNLYIIGEGEIRFSRTLEAVTKVAIVDLANIYCAGCKNQPLGWLIVRISYIYIYINCHPLLLNSLVYNSSSIQNHLFISELKHTTPSPCRALHPATVSTKTWIVFPDLGQFLQYRFCCCAVRTSCHNKKKNTQKPRTCHSICLRRLSSVLNSNEGYNFRFKLIVFFCSWSVLFH